MSKQYFVYILRSKSGVLYIGITSNLVKRIWEHKHKIVAGFTKKYNVDILVYFELYANPNEAIAREKQLKKWSRKKKIILIVKSNPKFEEVQLN
ncbi:TPA: hypothetical protein DIV55_06805 [Patescibacteria group bacterium]|nr:hypothetical protein [Patescibacteria group bacterium]